MSHDWSIRPARRPELVRLTEIERASGVRFDALPELAGIPEVLTSLADFAEAFDLGLVWVAAAAWDGAPVGFAYADPFDGALHLEELDVLPEWGRRGIGAALVEVVVAEARTRELPAVTLTTFRDVVWNAPFYSHLGFRVVAPADWSPAMAGLVAYEAERGIPAALRVVMRRDVVR
jgi:GNAT superfamily N-acetyltransferase